MSLFYYDGIADAGVAGGVGGVPLKVVVGGISGDYQEEKPTYSINLSLFMLSQPNFTFSPNTSIRVGCVYNTSIVVNTLVLRG